MRILSSSIYCWLFFSIAVPTWAVEPPDAGQLLRESQPTPQVQTPPSPPDIRIPPSQATQPLPDDVLIEITGFRFHGHTRLSEARLEAVLAPVVGQKLSLAGLQQAIEAVTSAYRAQGYLLAYAFLPPQTLRPGDPVQVEILEGTLESVRIHSDPGHTRVPRRLLEAHAARLTPGQPVRDDELTETALRLNDLPALRARILLQPGEQTGSTRAIIEIAEETQPGHVTLLADTHGNHATGYYRGGVAAVLSSPLRLGDRLSLYGLSSTTGKTQSAGLGWQLPLSAKGTRLNLDYAWVRYELGEEFAALDANGWAHSASLSLSRQLVRRLDRLVELTLGGEGQWLNDSLDSLNSHNRRHLYSAWSGVAWQQADGLLAGGITALELTLTAGRLQFDNDQAVAEDADPTAGLDLAGDYLKLAAAFSRDQSLGGAWSAHVALNGQWSNQNLDSAEQISLGGPYGVRSYPVGEASADIALISSAAVRYTLPSQRYLPGKTQLAAFFDHGYAKINADPLQRHGNKRHLYGPGIGLDWQWQQRYGLKASVAWRQGEKPMSDNLDGSRPTAFLQVFARY